MSIKQVNPKDEFGRFKEKHGMYGTRLYHIWNGLTGRCLNKKNKDYSDYGGRGITVCDEWRKSTNFFSWALSNGYREDLTLDRIDCNKGYCPENCRFITNEKQQRNKRNNRLIEFNGEIHCVAEWAEITGIPKQTITSRIRYGWAPEEILTVKPSHRNNLHRRAGEEE